MEPTVTQIKVAQKLSRESGGLLVKTHLTSRGWLVNEYRSGEFEAVLPCGTVVQDTVI